MSDEGGVVEGRRSGTDMEDHEEEETSSETEIHLVPVRRKLECVHVVKVLEDKRGGASVTLKARDTRSGLSRSHGSKRNYFINSTIKSMQYDTVDTLYILFHYTLFYSAQQ